MSESSVGLTFITLAVSGISTACSNLWARRGGDFFPSERNRERLVHLAKETACESVDEMLVTFPAGSTANLWNTAEVAIQYPSQEVLSLFGDW